MNVYGQTISLRLIEMTTRKTLSVVESPMLVERLAEELEALAKPRRLVHENAMADPFDEGNQHIGEAERGDENNGPEQSGRHSF